MLNLSYFEGADIKQSHTRDFFARSEFQNKPTTAYTHYQFIRLNPKKGPFPILPSSIARNS